MTTPKILAFDLGTTTGWAYMHGSWIESCVIRLPKASPALAYAELAAEIERILNTSPGLDVIAYEAVPAQAHSGGIAAHRWGGYEAILLLTALRWRVPYLGLMPTQWKRAAGLRSRTGPGEALAAARARWPLDTFATADEAVARWIAVAAEARMNGGTR